MTLAQQLIAGFEGVRLTAYKDSLGLWTVGYGHLLEPQHDAWAGYTITEEAAENLLAQDMKEASALAGQFPYFDTMNEARQACLISMCYQLGSQPLHWPNFIAALQSQDYSAASAAGLDSLWARQTPSRAIKEMSMLESGNA